MSEATGYGRPSWIGAWVPKSPPNPWPKAGDYVVATKYADGDPGDHFCIGYYVESYDHCGQVRHIVADAAGKSFRANGFRRVARIGSLRGTWMVEHLALIERLRDRLSVWHWVRAPWSELREWEACWMRVPPPT
jgi:hypothetical protein